MDEMMNSMTQNSTAARRKRETMPYLTRLQTLMRETGLTHAELRQRGLLPDPEKETDADH